MKRPASYGLNSDEKAILISACASSRFTNIADEATAPDDSKYSQLNEEALAVADTYRSQLPNLTSALRSLISTPSCGLIAVQDLPVSSSPEKLALIVGNLLGKVARYRNEGAEIIPIKEEKTKPGDRPSFKNAREFYLHTDLSYAEAPPPYMMLYALTNDPEDGGFSVLCDVEEAVTQLSTSAIEELSKPQFLFPAPPHYSGPSEICFPILSRDSDHDGWRVRFRRDNLRSTTRSGIEAVIELVSAFNRTAYELALAPNSMIIADNRSFLHGRTAFIGSDTTSSKEPRCLFRLYIEPTGGKQ